MSSRRLDVERDICKKTFGLITTLVVRVAGAVLIAIADALLIRGCIVGTPAVLVLHHSEGVILTTLILAGKIRLVDVEHYTLLDAVIANKDSCILTCGIT